MVERVARAIGVADLNASAKSMPNVPMETMAEYAKHAADEGHYEAMARAAIEAMKPTSNAMDVAGVIYLRENHSDASGCFEEMIQAALKEAE
ncbi:hypothetical protein [Sinorhizobium sp. 22678]|uniref:hypothetical protein n=1 Tax=Sinorhizobium sp. 22678 TaxID=3453955 RepID=UPI003F871574